MSFHKCAMVVMALAGVFSLGLSAATGDEREISLHMRLTHISIPSAGYVIFVEGSVSDDGVVNAVLKVCGRVPFFMNMAGTIDSQGTLTLSGNSGATDETGTIYTILGFNELVVLSTGEGLATGDGDGDPVWVGRGHVIVNE